MPGMRSEAGEKSIQLKVRPAGVASNNTMATFVAPTAVAAAVAESEQSNAESSIRAGEKERARMSAAVNCITALLALSLGSLCNT